MQAETGGKVRYGMIGGGQGAFIGAAHRRAAALDGALELVCGTFSRDPANNGATGRELGLAPARVHASWQTLLADEARLPPEQRVELLVIVTPNDLHVPIAQAALTAGFHVFSEKPAGISLAEVQRLADTLAALPLPLRYALAHSYLGYPLVWEARERVARGELGALRKIHVEYPQGWLAQDLAATGNRQAAWRDDPAASGPGGCLGDIGTHAFSLAEFIGGQPITRLSAQLRSHLPGRRLDDDVMVLFETAAGASGSLLASQVCIGEENGLRIRLYGERGSLEWRQQEPNSLLQRSLDQPPQDLRAGLGLPWLSAGTQQRLRLPAGHPEGYLEALANLYRQLAAAIRDPADPAAGLPGIHTGWRGLAFIETALASHRRQGAWTPLPTPGA